VQFSSTSKKDGAAALEHSALALLAKHNASAKALKDAAQKSKRTEAAAAKKSGKSTAGAAAAAAAAVASTDSPALDAMASDVDDGLVAASKPAAGAKKRRSTAVAADSAPSAAAVAPKKQKKKAADRAVVRHLEQEVPVGGRDRTTATLHISRQLLFANQHCFGAKAKACIVCLDPLVDPASDAGCDGCAFHCPLPSVLHL
jgi:hypothetical protein